MLTFATVLLQYLVQPFGLDVRTSGGVLAGEPAAQLPILPPSGWTPDRYSAGQPATKAVKTFSLRHVYHHGSHSHPDVYRYIDITQEAALRSSESQSLRAKTVPTSIQRMTDRSKLAVDNLLEHSKNHGEAFTLFENGWTTESIPAPNVTDKATVISFAHMAANSYEPDPSQDTWTDIGGKFNHSESFGWEADGLRGHVFADETNSTIVIGFKGTSKAVFADDGETSAHDRVNDNLFASCCCGQGGRWKWQKVCDCMTSAFTCNTTCVTDSLMEKDKYYSAARDLYHDIAERYPSSDIWLAGHSMGGVVSSLLGLTYGLPALTFEAYPDALAASRLDLPVPPGYEAGSVHSPKSDAAIYHFGQTADPVFMGTCNGLTSTCTLGGYAIEGTCHTGKVCTYDTMADFGWRSSINNHVLLSVIPDVLEKYDEVAACEADTNCQDCYKWKFFDDNGSLPV